MHPPFLDSRLSAERQVHEPRVEPLGVRVSGCGFGVIRLFPSTRFNLPETFPIFAGVLVWDARHFQVSGFGWNLKDISARFCPTP